MGAVLITYNSRPLCRSTLDELIRSSPVSVTPLTHSSAYCTKCDHRDEKYATAACPHIPRAEAA